MHKQCVPGSFFSAHALQPENEATTLPKVRLVSSALSVSSVLFLLDRWPATQLLIFSLFLSCWVGGFVGGWGSGVDSTVEGGDRGSSKAGGFGVWWSVEWGVLEATTCVYMYTNTVILDDLKLVKGLGPHWMINNRMEARDLNWRGTINKHSIPLIRQA